MSLEVGCTGPFQGLKRETSVNGVSNEKSDKNPKSSWVSSFRAGISIYDLGVYFGHYGKPLDVFKRSM